MDNAPAQSPLSSASPAWGDRLLVIGVYALTVIVFGPLAGWLFTQARESEQLLHAFLVLLLAIGFVAVDDRRRWTLVWQFDATCQILLLSSYALVGFAFIAQWPLLFLPALGVTITSALRWLFGPARMPLAIGVGAAFAVFLFAAVGLPVFDYPLRIVAGEWSGWLLTVLGASVSLRWVAGAGEPLLILTHEGFPFHVAAECNGFGVVTASLMLTTLLVLVRPLPWFDRALYAVVALILAMAGNFVRIVVIVLLAQPVGLEHYHFMHEVVGTVTYYGTFVGLWCLIRSHGRRSKPAPEAPPRAQKAVG